MNVQQYLNRTKFYELDQSTCLDLIRRRKKTFQGFALIEQERGIIPANVSLSNSRGQDVLRLLLYRSLEEVLEAFDSVDLDHYREEVIDAANYLLSSLLIEESLFTDDEMAGAILSIARTHYAGNSIYPRFDLTTIGAYALAVAGEDVSDVLRNRAWMRRAQDPYFTGKQKLLDVVKGALSILLSAFPTWSEFCQMYFAKDEVLQFRLRTNY